MIPIQKIRFVLLWTLLALAPFHAFFITWMKSLLGSGYFVTLLSAWREGIVVLIGGLILLEVAPLGRINFLASPRRLGLEYKKIHRKLDLLDFLILGYGVLGLLWLPFQWKAPLPWLFGVRFDIFPFLLLLLVRHTSWQSPDKLFKIALISGGITVIFGLLHALVLPQDFLMNFGYSNQQGPYQPQLAISGCQYLEHTSSVCRATSTFSSPMRFASYLLLLAGLVLPFLKGCAPWAHSASSLAAARPGWWIFFAAIFANIFLTYSRAAWIGSIVFLVLAGGFFFRDAIIKHKKKVMSGLGILLILGLLGFGMLQQSPKYRDFVKIAVWRNSSTSEHLQHLKESAKLLQEHPWGIGLGTAGPASLRFEKLVTENWYLQIAVEMGIPGLVLFLGILIALFYALLKSKSEISFGLFCSLAGIGAAAMFLHFFEETSMILTLMALAGISTSHRQS